MAATTDGSNPTPSTTPAVIVKTTATSTTSKTKKAKVKKTVIPATLPPAGARDPKTISGVENLLSTTSIQALEETAIAARLMTAVGFITAYGEADQPVLNALDTLGVDDASMVTFGRWTLAMLAATQARDAAAAALASAVSNLASYKVAFAAQQKTLKGQLRLALQGNPAAAQAFGLKKAAKATPKKKVAAKS